MSPALKHRAIVKCPFGTNTSRGKRSIPNALCLAAANPPSAVWTVAKKRQGPQEVTVISRLRLGAGGARQNSSLPHECGDPPRLGTPHSCGRMARPKKSVPCPAAGGVNYFPCVRRTRRLKDESSVQLYPIKIAYEQNKDLTLCFGTGWLNRPAVPGRHRGNPGFPQIRMLVPVSTGPRTCRHGHVRAVK